MERWIALRERGESGQAERESMRAGATAVRIPSGSRTRVSGRKLPPDKVHPVRRGGRVALGKSSPRFEPSDSEHLVHLSLSAWAGERVGQGTRRQAVELSPGSTSWRRGDLRPADGQIMEVGASMSADIAGLFVMLPGQAVVRWVAMGLLARLSSTLTLTPVRLP
jgi:hypothetical protein